VCRQFQDVGDEILNRKCRCLKTLVKSHLAAVVQEENTLLGKHVQSGIGSTGRAGSESAVPESPPQPDQIRLLRSCRLLNLICNEISLLRGLCYRPLFLSEFPQKIRYSSACFKGELIDVVHRILRLVKSKNIKGGEDEYMYVFISLVDKWRRRLKRAKPQNESQYPDLFGSKVIGLLKCNLDCKNDITVNIDSGAWCYIKGQYKINGTAMHRLPNKASGLKPLSIKQQIELHDMLYNLARLSNEWQVRRQQWFDIIDINFQDITFQVIYHHIFRDDHNLVFKVDLKCRKELAPVELIELLKEQSYDDIEEESAPGANTVQDLSLNLELKLQIEENYQMFGYVDKRLHKYLIRHRHTDP
jgi:hypothetical protein